MLRQPPFEVVLHGQLAGCVQLEHVSVRRSTVNEPARSRAEEIAEQFPGPDRHMDFCRPLRP
jgi:hypothetical protein